MSKQEGAVHLVQTINDGDIDITNGLIAMNGGLESMVYLCLFGGDEDGGNWWGNITEANIARRYHSETQKLLRSIPAIPFNLKRIQDAAIRDLSVFITEKIASSVRAEAGIPTVNHVKLTVFIEANGTESQFTFIENWKAESQ